MDRWEKSLRELLKKQGISKISISMLAENAGLSRQNFYKKYEDKFSFIFSIFRSKTEEIHKEFILTGDWEKMVRSLLDVFLEDAMFYQKIFHNIQYRQDFLHRWHDDNQKYLAIYVGAKMKSKEIEAVYRIYTYGGSMYIVDWVISGFKETKDEVVDAQKKAMPEILKSIYL